MVLKEDRGRLGGITVRLLSTHRTPHPHSFLSIFNFRSSIHAQISVSGLSVCLSQCLSIGLSVPVAAMCATLPSPLAPQLFTSYDLI
jgi:hypothetical protein